MSKRTIKSYEGDAPYIFISYCHENMDVVLPVIERLVKDGYRVWYDGGISAGSKWADVIAGHLSKCAVCMVFVSSDWLASKFCKKEITFAINNEKPILSVKLEEVDESSGTMLQLCDVQHISKNEFTDEQDFYEELYAADLIESCRKSEKERIADTAPIAVRATASMAADRASEATMSEPIASQDSAPRSILNKSDIGKIAAIAGGVVVAVIIILLLLFRGCADTADSEDRQTDTSNMSALAEPSWTTSDKIVTITDKPLPSTGKIEGPISDPDTTSFSDKTTSAPTTTTTTAPTTDDPTHSVHKHTALSGKWETDAQSHWHICTCNAVIEKSSHTYGAWNVTSAATCTAKGSQKRICTVCGYTQTESTPEKEHIEVIDAAVEATCGKSGLTMGKHCSVCGTVTIKQATVAAKTHTYVNRKCTICGDVKSESEGLQFTVQSNGSYTVSGMGSCSDTDVVIPFSYNGMPVIGIDEKAFNWNSRLTSITIPGNIVSIGKEAFYNCSNLTSVTMLDGVTTIGERAFEASEKLTSVKIPDSVTNIGKSAFYNCTSLTSVTIPNGITRIEDMVFYSCDGLTEVKIPDSVTSIGDLSFSYCDKLERITIPKTVMEISSGTLVGCNSLTSIVVESGNPMYHSKNNCLIETQTKTLMAGCYNSVIPDDGSVTRIGNSAFRNLDRLKSITIPGSVKEIGQSAFGACHNLTNVVICEGVTTIGVDAFEYCTGLTSVTIPSSVTAIAVRAFEGCSSLAKVTIPASVKLIGESAFAECTRLSQVTLESPNDWYIFETQGASSGTSVKVSGTAMAADYLRDTYCNYYWKKQ